MTIRDRIARWVSTEQPSVNETLKKSESAYEEPIAYFSDPMMLYQASGYKEKYTNLSYEILRKVVARDSVIAAIVLTRVHQVSSFSRPSRISQDGVGFKIVPKDKSKKLSEQDELMILQLEKFISQMGYDRNNRRDSFSKFLKKFTRDSLTYDQACFEIVPDRKGYPAEVHCVDAATVRVVADNPFNHSGRDSRDNEGVAYVQVVDGAVMANFSHNELAFCVRNPRSDIRLQDYGFSEVEQLITQITSHLYAEEYNSRYFSQGGTTKGIINLKTTGTTKDSSQGQIQTAQLESFRAQWNAQVGGLTGAWKTPVLQVPNGIEYINVAQSNREMEFEKWMNYLVNICCSIFQIDPAEINFANNGGVGGSQASLLDSGTEGKLKNSRDKGLRPLLRFIEDCITKNIVERFSEDYTFVFEGLDLDTEDAILDRAGKQIRTYKTINEVREENGLPPIEGGHLILDASYINYINTKEMSEQQEEDQGEEGDDEGYDDNEEGYDDSGDYDNGYDDDNTDEEDEEYDIDGEDEDSEDDDLARSFHLDF